MVETLYFKCLYSFIHGNLQDTEMYFSFLKEEFKKKNNVNILKPHQFNELKIIRDSIKNKKIQECSWILDTNTQANIAPDEVYNKNQIELVKQIHQQEAQLKDLIHSRGSLYLYDIEHSCPPVGVIDMVYRDDWFVYPIEVKVGEGKHDILGQIQKYTLYFKLNLHLKHYMEVQSITLCSHYQNFTLIELKKHNVITLKYDKIGDNIKLSRI